MRAPEDVDVAVVGAGHNGLAATALVAKRGLRVLCLEKTDYVSGMAVTREILKGCRNDVGASLLFPLAKGVAEELELARGECYAAAANRRAKRSISSAFTSDTAQNVRPPLDQRTR